MKKQYMLYLLLSAILFIIPANKAKAEDTLTVQTFTFDDISKRRDVFQFPDASESFRKILMYYTLKCDPHTQGDFPCGEWDYIADTKVYRHTGIMDSTKGEHPLYMVKGQSPVKIELSASPGTSIFQYNQFNRTNPTITDRKDVLINGQQAQTIDFDGKFYRMQFIIDKATIKSQGLTKGNLAGIKLYAAAGAIGYRNFSIRARGISTKTATGFVEDQLKELYFKDVDIKEGENEFFFKEDFAWTQFSNLLIDISFERDEVLPGAILTGWVTTDGYLAKAKDPYLTYSAQSEFVDCGLTPELKNAQKLTFETWVKVGTWNNWATIMDLQGLVQLQMGDKAGQVYCIVRNPDNTNGNAIGVLPTDSWVHLAMVYDGTQEDNASKLKLYVNGIPKTLVIASNIPSNLPDSALKFFIGSSNYSGGINEVRVFNAALDEATINEWMYKSNNLTTLHPFAANLIRYYRLDEGAGITTADASPYNQTGKLIGCPLWTEKTPKEINSISKVDQLPKMDLIFGELTGNLEAITKETAVPQQLSTIHKYKIENYAPVEDEVRYSYLAGWNYKISPNGVKLDSTYNQPTETITNDTLHYFGKPFEILDDWEIARFITPYGINLDLGPRGFTWVYDVTDFAGFLRDEVDFQAHNTQELIDVRFAFIKGTPPRNMLSLSRVWGKTASYSYRDLSDDFKLAETTLDILPQAKQVKLISRITGHGHQSNDGSAPHCCEWKDNTHYLYANKSLAYQWQIWRDDCAENPVYPQGGTWQGSREGWCPGDVVRDFEFELGKYVTNGKIDLDYSLTPVPEDNKGMGNGNYVISTYLAQYAEANFATDMEIYNVISPTSDPLYSRCNPICSNPSIVIRNNGNSEISTFILEYGVSGGQKETYDYIGKKKIQPNLKDTIELPINSNIFWIGDDAHKFTVNVVSVNGTADLQPVNNSFTTKIDMPDLFNEVIYFELTTNARGQNFSYKLTDLEGKVYFDRKTLVSNKTYRDTLRLNEGCYTIQLADEYKYGLEYWAYTEQGKGSFRIYNAKGNLLKLFNPDCGAGYTYSFNLGPAAWVCDAGFDDYFTLAPMPADNYMNLGFKKLSGEIQITIFDFTGKNLAQLSTFANNEGNYRIDLTNYAPGIYYMLLNSPQGSFKQKFIVK